MSERKRRRRFTAEHKAEAVKRLVESSLPLRDVAGDLDLSVSQLSQWRNEHLAAGTAETYFNRSIGFGLSDGISGFPV